MKKEAYLIVADLPLQFQKYSRLIIYISSKNYCVGLCPIIFLTHIQCHVHPVIVQLVLCITVDENR